ncbi:hypothetical protein PH210_07955 [Paenibacillus sp. BSR1-1]|uniref:hypothetical protein n=1 Tax=Paenibacillus sp. BSR1-1 TaxID=3020845 RepID=UPI0025B1762D|nr:hypothetical protein [Paenibacillus sp. BSR1-1]MDN3016130.1 hypothetical protein [Paenibacillus sp. BSR1-1]
MNIENTQKVTFQLENDLGKLEVKGDIIGESQIPFFDDLKFKGVIALLNSIDKQNFIESGNHRLFDHFITEIEETLDEMKKYDQFQGKII